MWDRGGGARRLLGVFFSSLLSTKKGGLSFSRGREFSTSPRKGGGGLQGGFVRDRVGPSRQKGGLLQKKIRTEGKVTRIHKTAPGGKRGPSWAGGGYSFLVRSGGGEKAAKKKGLIPRLSLFTFLGKGHKWEI